MSLAGMQSTGKQLAKSKTPLPLKSQDMLDSLILGAKMKGFKQSSAKWLALDSLEDVTKQSSSKKPEEKQELDEEGYIHDILNFFQVEITSLNAAIRSAEIVWTDEWPLESSTGYNSKGSLVFYKSDKLCMCACKQYD